MRVRGIAVLLLLIAATTGSAQSAGTFEITGFGRFTRFDDPLSLQEEPSGGGSLGFYLLRNVAIEAEGAYTGTHVKTSGVSVSNIPLRARLSLHLPMGGYASGIRVGAGYVRNLYRKDVSFDDNGFTGIAGFRWGLSPSYGFRVDGTADYVRSPEGGRSGEYLNWGAQVGLSVVFGGGRGPAKVKDKDQDSVADNFDRCPNTLFGRPVDSAGCAANQKDADRDAVNDEADACGGTAAGEPVDAEGCSNSQRDDDRDKVLNPADRCPGSPAGQPVDSTGCPTALPDRDKDGVPDGADQCPNSPAGQPVNPSGCPVMRDSDVDGVPDGADQCPNSPAGQPVNGSGCSVMRDSDADGVPDGADQCPNSPAGQPVNDSGCPVMRDSDADGVPDGRDLCLNTPKGETINENGCTIIFQKQARSVILRGVNFQTGRATLTPEARDILRDIAAQLVENPQYRVQISGHTDASGSRATNMHLSLARARAVERFLEASGVPLTQVTAKGFGPDVPIASNKTAEGKAQNRRVELNRTN